MTDRNWQKVHVIFVTTEAQRSSEDYADADWEIVDHGLTIVGKAAEGDLGVVLAQYAPGTWVRVRVLPADAKPD